MLKILIAMAMLLSSLGARAAESEYIPQAERVVDNVYAIVGPFGLRGPDNDGLNATFGFIVTPDGVILVDSGASRLGAKKLARAIRAVTDLPVRWVINTGSQDHRWLGNDFFAGQGAQIIALRRTATTQAPFAAQHMQRLERLIGARLAGTNPLPATTLHDGATATLVLGGETLVLQATDAHFPGDAMIHLPKHGVVFAGDLLFVDRILGVLPWSNVTRSRMAFRALAALQPVHIVPGHGRVCDLAKARREVGDYYDFLANTIGTAAKAMEPMDEVLDRHADLPAFRHLENYRDLHRANMNRAFTEFETQ
jgi:glyoxylase-like metal-dependent hydrolase (beta-lactamase superfamily II)